jgi:hypothetical protein
MPEKLCITKVSDTNLVLQDNALAPQGNINVIKR